MVGPDVNEFILGSEGTLGIVTEAVVKLQPLPEKRVFGAIAFPTFEKVRPLLTPAVTLSSTLTLIPILTHLPNPLTTTPHSDLA